MASTTDRGYGAEHKKLRVKVKLEVDAGRCGKKWTVMHTGTRLICAIPRCDTISDLDTVIANTRADAARTEKINILSKQLFAGDLKKKARDDAYAWVRANAPDRTVDLTSKQETLL
jgi:hypothetical protein